MTDIILKKTKLGRELTVKGHSGEDMTKAGSVVCAAISTLTQTIAQNLYEYEDEGEVDIIDITIKSGNTVLSYITDNENVNFLVDRICKGFWLVSDCFPDRVTFDVI
ncbi:MAG: ribosomal-processing cysteine protease Prp [Ruminiclostridium sp.]|nr:ribosomal-processing cysteine protease Prp [Ruminiclostridium sp.]